MKCFIQVLKVSFGSRFFLQKTDNNYAIPIIECHMFMFLLTTVGRGGTQNLGGFNNFGQWSTNIAH